MPKNSSYYRTVSRSFYLKIYIRGQPPPFLVTGLKFGFKIKTSACFCAHGGRDNNIKF